MDWTPSQTTAIKESGKNIIVSAGAGSGKTAVLTERVIYKLKQGIHINELLILTFTNAAAQEMKDRIRKRIKLENSLKDELDLLDEAYITTFDAYSLSLVKKYHTILNISQNIKIVDQTILEQVKREILDNIFDKNYLSPLKDFTKLIEDFSLKDDKELKEYILKVYQKLELKYDKTIYLENYFESNNFDTLKDEYLSLLKDKQNNLKEVFNILKEYIDDDFLKKIEECFTKVFNASTYQEFKNSLEIESIKSPRNCLEIIKELKKEMYDIVKEMRAYCLYETENEMFEEINSTKDNTKVIIRILKEFDKELENYKNKQGMYYFTDIFRMAITLASIPTINEELKSAYKEILVDEYQDTSDLQELFISLISHNNIYTVGDIKQSIYRFRNANPNLFQKKYEDYENLNGGIKIDLLDNFRSRKEVLEPINLLFNVIMDKSYGGADYSKSHQMLNGNKEYKKYGKNNNYQLEIITYEDKKLKNLSKEEEEAFQIGFDILEKINSNFLVYDKDLKNTREATYKDFVILLDKSKYFDTFKKIFEYLQIPLSIKKEESLTKDNDIYIIKNLLQLLTLIKENIFDSTFKYLYMSISRSFLYKRDDFYLYDLFISGNYKDDSLYQKCLTLITEMDNTPLSSYLYQVLEEFDYEEKLFTIGSVKQYRIRCEYLYNLCLDFENEGKNIYDFIKYLDNVFLSNNDISFNSNGNDTNSCQIMTIHKSKGLEFPICYYALFSSRFNLTELKEKIIFDNKYGIVLPKVDGYYKDTIIKTIIKDKTHKDEVAEKIRLLYVALTRAKEKLIMVIPKQEEDLEVRGKVLTRIREKYNSFLSIIKSVYTILLPYIKEKEVFDNKEYLTHIKKVKQQEIVNEKLVDEINISTEEIEKKHYSKQLLAKENIEKIEFGSLVHKTLELIDFKNPDYNGLDNKISIIIKRFLESDLLKKYNNDKTYKEYEFMYEEENNFYHGVVDLLIDSKDEIVIIDYKLKEIDDLGYDIQLKGYRKYFEKRVNKKIKCYLYSLLNGKYREVK